MKEGFSRTGHRGFWLAAALAGAAVIVFAPLIRLESFAFELYALASSIVLIDALDIAARFMLRRTGKRSPDTTVAARPRPYAIVMSVHNAQHELDQVLESLAPYKHLTWIIDDASTDGTVQRLRRAGWYCIESPVNRKKPGALKELVARLPPEIATVIVLDPDVRIRGNLDKSIAAFQSTGAAAACPRLTIRPDGFLGDFQTMEYAVAFGLGRSSLHPTSITSGVAVYDRKALGQTLARHSLSVYAEDLENSFILLSQDLEIRYMSELEIETEGKRNMRGWFSQRVGWSFGLLKVYIERFAEMKKIAVRSPLTFYQFAIYFGVLSIALLPLKIVSLALLTLSFVNGLDAILGTSVVIDRPYTNPGFFAAAYFKYTIVLLATAWWTTRDHERSRILSVAPLYFFYCLLQIVPVTVGYLNWLSLRLIGLRVYADHYDARPALRRASPDASNA